MGEPDRDGSAAIVRDLSVELSQSRAKIVEDVSFILRPGQITGVVGESGSGKTTLGLALLGFARRGTRIAGGSVEVGKQDILRLSERELRAVRGTIFGHVPQDPATALNPALRVGAQLKEVIIAHLEAADARMAHERIPEALADVGLPCDDRFLRRYPHELSGGQKQRICLAIAMFLRPRVLVLDEPTTGLDVTTQARVLETVRDLCVAHQVAGVYVSHDLSVVNYLADEVLVMYGGRLVECGPRRGLFSRPSHPYTRRLLQAIPNINRKSTLEPIPGHVPEPGERPAGCVFALRCDKVLPECIAEEPSMEVVAEDHLVRCIRATELFGESSLRVDVGPEIVQRAASNSALRIERLSAFHGRRRILNDVSFELGASECLALVGESGSGKTTLARAIVGLHAQRSGGISFKGVDLALRARDRPSEVRRAIQYVFQNPYGSLNPRRTIGDTLRVPIRQFYGRAGKSGRRTAEELLEEVALPGRYAQRYPDQLSGGERQRVAIARALACEPEILICDEITSALDVSVQAAILQLLERLREERTMGLIFVTHNLALVMSVAERVLVLERGSIVEVGTTGEVLTTPSHAYTKQLIADTPSLAR